MKNIIKLHGRNAEPNTNCLLCISTSVCACVHIVQNNRKSLKITFFIMCVKDSGKKGVAVGPKLGEQIGAGWLGSILDLASFVAGVFEQLLA